MKGGKPISKSARSQAQKIFRIAPTFFICGFVAVVATGCLGPKVLTETVVHVPALDPKVELRFRTNAPPDVLVIYDDLESQSDRIKRRAFYLFANEDRIMRGRRPHYVKLSESEHLQPIPMLKGSPDDPNAGTNEMYGIELSSRRYRLESHGKLLSSFELPQYERWLTAKKLFLFPGAVGADAVGGAAAIGAAAAVTDPVGVGNTVAGALQKH